MTDARQAAVAVSLKGVTKAYAGSSERLLAVGETSLDVTPGEFVAVVGPSGCGKSTLLMLIAGLIPPTSGAVYIDGHRVERPYTNVGFVFQRDVLLEWRTVLSNVLLPVQIKHLSFDVYRERARELLDRVGLRGFERKYPHELSGGMRQRVSLCRALIHDPPLLLMDEPFAALDAFTREELGFYLLKLWRTMKKTVVFVTHAIEEAAILADRVIVMSPRPGQIVQSLEVALPRPRTPALKEGDRFHAVVRRVRDAFKAKGILPEDQKPEEPEAKRAETRDVDAPSPV